MSRAESQLFNFYDFLRPAVISFTVNTRATPANRIQGMTRMDIHINAKYKNRAYYFFYCRPLYLHPETRKMQCV